MYQAGDLIVYGGEGVCRVEALGKAPVAAADQDRRYYTLAPLYHSGVIYAPTDVSIPMRPILSREAAWALIRGIPHMEGEMACPQDAKQAAQEYRAVLQTYDCENLLRLIRLIYNKNSEAISMGKSYGQTDDKFLKRAKELLYGELAISLDIPLDEVEQTIIRTVEAEEERQRP